MRERVSLFSCAAFAIVAIVAASVAGCAIVNRGGGDDECFDLDQLCPNLQCEAGHVVVDGCEICECEGATCGDVGDPPPSCPQPSIVNCQWTCGGCVETFDCPAGFVCAFISSDPAEPPPPGGGGGAAPEPVFEGVCVDDGSTCVGADDCGANQFCQNGFCFTKSECESDAECSSGLCDLRCESDPSCPACDVCLLVGTCVDIFCTADEECPRGRCDFSGQGGGSGGGGDGGAAPAPPEPGGVCTFDVVVCSSDDDCVAGTRCNAGVEVCDPPPDCVEGQPCDDVCFGVCVQ